MFAELRQVRFPLETTLLVGLAFALPLWEFWKALLWILYSVTWLVNRVRHGGAGGGWGLWDSLVVLWVASAYACAAFAGIDNNAWGDTTELAMYVLTLWLVMRGGYTARELTWVLAALVASTLAGLAHGYWQLLVTHRRRDLQLHSVGHVNHSAIYLAIMLGVCAAWVLARWQAWSALRRAGGLAVLGLVLVSLVVTASRGAVAVGLALLLMLALAWWPRWRAPLAAAAAGIVLVAAAAVLLDAGVVRKHEQVAAMDNLLSSRAEIWNTGLAAWERFPWFGVGKDNYGLVTRERIRAWRTEAGKDYDPARYLPYNHAHNLYVNTLAERGAVGLAVLAAVMLAWLGALLRHRPRRTDPDLAWLAWGGAASAWLVTAGVGLVNTTLHHEHGLLAALLLGLWLSTLPRRAS